MLSLRRLRMLGPTLPSRLAGAPEDGLLLPANRWARFENRRMRPPLLLLATSDMALYPREFVLVFLESTDSGSWKLEGKDSSSRPRMGSGEAWTEEYVVRKTVSGDMIGEPCCEFEVPDEALIADMGIGTGCDCDGKDVWT